MNHVTSRYPSSFSKEAILLCVRVALFVFGFLVGTDCISRAMMQILLNTDVEHDLIFQI